MTQFRAVWSRIPILGFMGLAVGAWFLRRHRPRPRPTLEDLIGMDDEDFAAFIRSTGIGTITTTSGGRAD